MRFFIAWKKTSAEQSIWIALLQWGLIGACILILGSSLLAGCGTKQVTTIPVRSISPTANPGPLHVVVQTTDKAFTITLEITPDRAGLNRFHASVLNNHAHVLATHIVITLYTTMQDMAMGTDSIVLHAEGDGQFGASSNVLSMSGDWALGITLQTSDHVIHKAGVRFVLP